MALLLLVASAPPTARAAQVPGHAEPLHGQVKETAPREVIVVFSRRASGSDRAALRRSLQTPVTETIPGLPQIQLLSVPVGRSVSTAAAGLERSSLVRSAEPNHRADPLATIPNDTYFSSQWALNNTGQTPPFISNQRPTPVPAGTPDADVDAPEAWDITTGNDNVTVAVIDTGVALDHPDLVQNIWHNPGESGGGKETNGVDDDGDGFVDDFRGWDFYGSEDNDPSDEYLHGTFVAGIIGGVGSNSLGISGLSPHVRLMALKAGPPAGGSYVVFDILQAIAYAATHGANIVNLSLGAHAEDQNAFQTTISSYPNVLFVAAAGNEGTDNEVTPRPPCTTPEPNVICVAATDQNDVLWDSSNWGATSVDLGAPGVDVLSTVSGGFLWTDDFNTPLAGRWATAGTNNSWAATTELRASGDLADSPGGNYLNNTDSYAQRSVDLTGAAACELDFFAQWDLGANDNLYVQMFDASGSPAYYWVLTPATAPYSYIPITVPEALNGRPDVRVLFRLISDGAGAADGIHVDLAAMPCWRLPTYDGQSYQYLSGTSNATPMVTGAAALLIAYRPGASVAQLKKALLDSIDPLPSLSGKTVTGGRLNARHALDLIGSAIPNTYVRPKGASPTRMSLVPAYLACLPGLTNRTHGAPLSYQSCAPPLQPSTLTIGSPDANGAGANSVGSLTLKTITGNPSTPADEADLKLDVSITDVRKKSDLSDYAGQLNLGLNLRITDKVNGSGAEPATMVDLAFGFPFNCAATPASATVGSTCSVNTTFDALFPGIAKEGARNVWQLGQVRVNDAGADGDPYTAGDNHIFAAQGVFVP